MPNERAAPNPVDVLVGSWVRIRRKQLGVSQTSLADSLAITFQQVQKYERGANRISASKLFEISKALHTSIEYFFEGCDKTGTHSSLYEVGSENSVHLFLATTEGIELAQTFPRIAQAKRRRRIVDLVKALAESNG